MAPGSDGAPGPDVADGAPFTWDVPSDGPEEPEVRYATWGRRGLGFLLDFILMASLPVAFFILFGISVPDTADPNPPISAVSWVWFWCLAFSCAGFVLYPVWFIGRRGQTPGMRRMQIRLFHMDREGNLEAPSSQRVWGRTVLALVCWFLFFAWILDYLWPMGDRRRRCLHDLVVGTVAVDMRDELGGAEDVPRPSAQPEAASPRDPSTAASFLWEVSLATTESRAVGFFVDAACMSIVPVLVYVGFAASLTHFNDQRGPFGTASVVLLCLFVASLSVFVAYPAWFIGRRGQTPGMKRMGIRLYRIEGEGGLSAPDWATAWRRSAVAMGFWLVFAFGPAVDYLWSFDNERRQCLHDKFGRTIAVSERDGRRDARTR